MSPSTKNKPSTYVMRKVTLGYSTQRVRPLFITKNGLRQILGTLENGN
jgi:hypothetical protein